MIFLHEPVVLPTQFLWFMLLMMIGIFGFLAQACSVFSIVKGSRIKMPLQTLLTMGLQRETAGRGTIAVYAQVRIKSLFLNYMLNFRIDYFRIYFGAHRFPYRPLPTVHCRDPNYCGICIIRRCTLPFKVLLFLSTY